MSIESKIDNITNTTSSLVQDAENAHLNSGRPNWLCFTALAANSTARLDKYTASAPDISIKYSTDGGDTWSTYTWDGVNGKVITIAKVGDKVYWRGLNKTLSDNAWNTCHVFHMSGTIAASGNVMSLLDPTCQQTVVPDNAFKMLFSGTNASNPNSALVTAPELPATTLGAYCYYCMFLLCVNLKKAPALPARVFPAYCYSSMFQNSGIEEAELPQEYDNNSFASNCFTGMFQGCANLKKVKVGFTTWGSTSNWLNAGGAGSVFECPSTLTIPSRDASGVPATWAVIHPVADPRSDWNESDSTKPTYIMNKPTIPTVNDATVTINQGGVQKGTFTLNQSSNATVNLDGGSSDSYDPIVDHQLEYNHKYLIKGSDLFFSHGFNYTLNNNTSDDILFDILINEEAVVSASDNFHVDIGGLSIGYRENGRQPTFGLYRYRIGYRYFNNSMYAVLMNADGGIIQILESSDLPNSMIASYYKDSSSVTDLPYIPLTNDYYGMPYGGFVTPLDKTFPISGMDFEQGETGNTLDFSSNDFDGKYFHLYSDNPMIHLGDNEINNFLYFRTTNRRVTLSICAGSNAHVYMNSGSNDALSGISASSDGKKYLDIITWCEYLSSNSVWRRYFQKGGSNTMWYLDSQSLPGQPS